MRYRLVTNERQGAPKGTGSFGAPLGMGPEWDQTNPSPLVPRRP